MMFLRFLFYELIYNEIDVFTFFILGLIKFLILINIYSFVFSSYKIKSHFLVPIKFFISILVHIKFSINTFSPCQKFPSTVLVPKMLKENVTWIKKCDFIL